MSHGGARAEEPPFVESTLAYLGDASGTPTNYLEVEPPEGVPRFYPRVRQPVRIHDARGLDLSLDREGFVLALDPDGLIPDFRDEEAIQRDYYPAVRRLIRRVAGASKVLVFDHTHRSSALAERAGDGTDTAVDEVHNDYTARSGPERVRELLSRLAPEEDAARLMARRYAIFNVWRPTNGTVEQKPLALCDMQSMAPTDFVDAVLRWRHRTGFVCAVRASPRHRWYYFPAQEPQEASVFKCYDAVEKNGARFGAHTAFEDPHSPPGARTRESIEVRVIAFFDEQ
jgi:hypothetical protein